MEQAMQEAVVPHPIFAEATSIEHFVELLRAHHAECMKNLPPEQRYEFGECQIRFEAHAADDPEYCSDVAWGEYHLRFKLRFKSTQRSAGKAFGEVRRDFPFLEILSSQGSGPRHEMHSEQLHGTSIYLESFPKLQAEFEALQELNNKHDAHVRQLDSQTQETCDNDAEMQKTLTELNSHRVSVYLLEAKEKKLREQIASNIKTSNPEPDADVRAALLQKFADR